MFFSFINLRHRFNHAVSCMCMINNSHQYKVFIYFFLHSLGINSIWCSQSNAWNKYFINLLYTVFFIQFFFTQFSLFHSFSSYSFPYWNSLIYFITYQFNQFVFIQFFSYNFSSHSFLYANSSSKIIKHTYKILWCLWTYGLHELCYKSNFSRFFYTKDVVKVKQPLLEFFVIKLYTSKYFFYKILQYRCSSVEDCFCKKFFAFDGNYSKFSVCSANWIISRPALWEI